MYRASRNGLIDLGRGASGDMILKSATSRAESICPWKRPPRRLTDSSPGKSCSRNGRGVQIDVRCREFHVSKLHRRLTHVLLRRCVRAVPQLTSRLAGTLQCPVIGRKHRSGPRRRDLMSRIGPSA